MERKAITEEGVCYVSIRTEEEISRIQSELEEAWWIPQTVRFLEAIKVLVVC